MCNNNLFQEPDIRSTVKWHPVLDGTLGGFLCCLIFEASIGTIPSCWEKRKASVVKGLALIWFSFIFVLWFSFHGDQDDRKTGRSCHNNWLCWARWERGCWSSHLLAIKTPLQVPRPTSFWSCFPCLMMTTHKSTDQFQGQFTALHASDRYFLICPNF